MKLVTLWINRNESSSCPNASLQSYVPLNNIAIPSVLSKLSHESYIWALKYFAHGRSLLIQLWELHHLNLYLVYNTNAWLHSSINEAETVTQVLQQEAHGMLTWWASFTSIVLCSLEKYRTWSEWVVLQQDDSHVEDLKLKNVQLIGRSTVLALIAVTTN